MRLHAQPVMSYLKQQSWKWDVRKSLVVLRRAAHCVAAALSLNPTKLPGSSTQLGCLWGIMISSGNNFARSQAPRHQTSWRKSSHEALRFRRRPQTSRSQIQVNKSTSHTHTMSQRPNVSDDLLWEIVRMQPPSRLQSTAY